MDQDCLKTLVKSVDTQLFEIVNNLICSICQELFNKPTTTPCGHTFCNGCIKRVLASKDNSGCPLCKNLVKRYGLKGDEVKSTLMEICQEIPAAFKMDVEKLTGNCKAVGEDLVMTSKLSHLFNQEFIRLFKTNKQTSTTSRKTRRTNETKKTEIDSETFVPVLKRTKNVVEYSNAKKKKMDDLVSISQTEPASISSLCDSELDKKLKRIEKILPEDKVSEWFNAVGDNIYINSPSSFIEIDSKNDDVGREEETPTMIRKDYNKSGVQKTEDHLPVDPYEFIPSQNNKSVKKRRQRRSTGKKIPDFKSLQSFSKESIKRNKILMDDSKEEIPPDEFPKDDAVEKQITASQKFDQLLLESKEQKKCHLLYTASPSSSIQFLDASFHSKAETVRKTKSQRARKLLPEEDILFKSVELFSDRGLRSKRMRSSEGTKSGKKKKMIEVLEINSTEASELEKSEEMCLVKRRLHPPTSKLGELLKELLDDDLIYETRPPNAPVRLKDINLPTAVVENRTDLLTQNTELIGFCTQEETPDVKNFKQMVENMEKELNSSEYLMELEGKSEDSNLPEMIDLQSESFVNEEEKSAEDMSKMSQVVDFLHLGRLTPIRRRAKSSVVKLVFPIGLTFLARQRAVQNNSLPVAPKKQTCQVSTGIQTSQQVVSSFVQTSQMPQTSVDMPSVEVQTTQKWSTSAEIQTTQKWGTSAEIQTTQKWGTSAEVQTSQLFVSQEIQTTQIESEYAQVQTTQIESEYAQVQTTQIEPEYVQVQTTQIEPEYAQMQTTQIESQYAQVQTTQLNQLCENESTTQTEHPIRKPSHHHRKIIQKKATTESASQSPVQLCTPEEKLPDKDLIMDFEGERELEKNWRKTQTHQDLVEFKNKKNKEHGGNCLKLADIDSDDSDVQPPKRRISFRILSQDSVGGQEDDETQKVTPLERKLSQDEESEVVDLVTPKSQNLEDQMLRVLKNIDLDLPKGRNTARGEKSEESDSDIFVEETPPKQNRTVEDVKNVSKRGMKLPEEKENENSEGIDFICDSIPKGFSESFLLPSLPQRVPLTPEKNPKDEFPKKPSKIESIELSDENDQNQLNAFDGKAKAREMEIKSAQLKAAVVAWKRTETCPAKVPSQKKLCVVASSVKNPDLIKKFVNRFKLEYLNKPTKDMTHLIVGLHENDDNEVLPLCTPKLLFAMANKKWVVSEHWAETCLKMNMILPEESFETLDPTGGHGCQKARLSSEKLLKNCEIFLLGEFQMISKEEFADLIMDCGGIIVPTPEKFSFLPSKLRMIIADRDCLKLNEKQLQDLYQKHSTVILSRDVILMSIQSYRLVNFSCYMLHSTPEENLIKLGYPSPLVRNEEEDEEAEDSAGR